MNNNASEADASEADASEADARAAAAEALEADALEEEADALEEALEEALEAEALEAEALEAEALEASEAADYEWINKYKETEKEYNIFYKSEVLTIEVNYIFINKNNEIIRRKKRRVKYNKEAREIINFYPSKLIKKKYKLTAAFKYNNIIEEEDVLNDNEEEVYLTPINLDEEIIFEKTIEFFQDLNALYMIFTEQQKNNSTKEIGTKEIGTKEIGTKETGTKETGTRKIAFHKNKNKNTRKVINHHIK